GATQIEDVRQLIPAVPIEAEASVVNEQDIDEELVDDRGGARSALSESESDVEGVREEETAFAAEPEPDSESDRASTLQSEEPAPDGEKSEDEGSMEQSDSAAADGRLSRVEADRKSTRLNSSHVKISYAV